MADYTLQAELRSEKGKNAVRRLRQQKKVPAVVYGRGTQNVTLSVEAPELQKALKAPTSLLTLSVDGEERKVIVKELTTHPVKGWYQHVDFYEVAMDRAVETQAYLQIVGDEERANDGGILNMVLHQLDISCLPGSIPEYVEVDVSGVVIGDTVHVSDLALPAGVDVLTDEDEVVLTVSDPEAEAFVEEEEEEDVEEMEEPAVIGEEDEEEEEE